MNNEEMVYEAVKAGELEVRLDGSVWRLGLKRGNRWTGETRFVACKPRRAENRTGLGYSQVRTVIDGKRYHALSHRLVFLHFFGPIPPGLTINHKNGTKSDNRPENLELATYSEQIIHARNVLKIEGLRQDGARNNMAKLNDAAVREIRRRRAAGEPQKSIAEAFGVSHQAVSKITRGDRWKLV